MRQPHCRMLSYKFLCGLHAKNRNCEHYANYGHNKPYDAHCKTCAGYQRNDKLNEGNESCKHKQNSACDKYKLRYEACRQSSVKEQNYDYHGCAHNAREKQTKSESNVAAKGDESQDDKPKSKNCASNLCYKESYPYVIATLLKKRCEGCENDAENGKTNKNGEKTGSY